MPMSTANRPDPKIAIGGESPTAPPRPPVMVGLVQINNSFSGQNYLPYSVALLQTYVQKMAADPGRYAFLPPLYKRVRIADAVEALKDADARVRSEAVLALVKFGPDAREAVPALMEVQQRDRDALVRAQAGKALEKLRAAE